MPYAQLIIGPPGSGKSTYAAGMHHLLTLANEAATNNEDKTDDGDASRAPLLPIDRRHPVLINLDPANERPAYLADIDITSLIRTDEVMHELQLGPNGAIMYAMDFLWANVDWLVGQIDALTGGGEDGDADDGNHYFIIDLPGQVELFSQPAGSLAQILKHLNKQRNFQFCVMNLVDSTFVTEGSRYVAAVLLSLRSMLHLEYPFVHALSKMDLLRKSCAVGNHDMDGERILPFSLETYTSCHDLQQLLSDGETTADGATYQRRHRFYQSICEMISDFGLVGFHPLAVEDQHLMVQLLFAIDKANGYVYQTLNTSGNESIQEVSVRHSHADQSIEYAEEKYLYVTPNGRQNDEDAIIM